MPLRNECDWFDTCERDAYAYVAHPDKGVIPVCAGHVTSYQLSPITFVDPPADTTAAASTTTTSKEN